MMTTSEAKEMVELAIASAPRLRAAGVHCLRLGDLEIHVDLSAGDPAPVSGLVTGVVLADDPERDPRAHRPERPPLFKDPTTFGLPEGSKLPGYARDGDE